MSFEDMSNWFDSILTVIILVLLGSITMFLVASIVAQNYFKIKDLEYRRRFGSLFESLRLSRGKWPLVYNLWQIMRRLLFSVLVVFMGDYPVIQV